MSRGLDGESILQALGDVHRIYRWQERYTIVMRQVAQSLCCKLLDVRAAFLGLKRYEDYLCLDGIHPNDRGHRLIADTALEAIRGLEEREGRFNLR